MLTNTLVAECADLKHGGAHVAVKIVRDELLFRQAAVNEIKILQTLGGHCGILRICRGQQRAMNVSAQDVWADCIRIHIRTFVCTFGRVHPLTY